MLERYLHEYVKHYHQERNHQGVGNQLTILTSTHHHVAQIHCSADTLERNLNFYQRGAAQ